MKSVRRRLGITVGCVIGFAACVLAGYRSMIVLPTTADAKVMYVVPSPSGVSTTPSSETTAIVKLKPDDAVRLNRRFAQLKITSTLAPSDIAIVNRAAYPISTSSGGARYWKAHISHSQIRGLNLSLADYGSESVLTPAVVGVLNDYFDSKARQELGISATPVRPLGDERNYLLERLLRPFATVFDACITLIQGFADEIAAHPRQMIVPFVISALYYLLTFAGVFANAIFEALEHGPQDVPLGPRAVMRLAFTARGWMGAVASPIIWALVYGSMQTTQLS